MCDAVPVSRRIQVPVHRGQLQLLKRFTLDARAHSDLIIYANAGKIRRSNRTVGIHGVRKFVPRADTADGTTPASSHGFLLCSMHTFFSAGLLQTWATFQGHGITKDPDGNIVELQTSPAIPARLHPPACVALRHVVVPCTRSQLSTSRTFYKNILHARSCGDLCVLHGDMELHLSPSSSAGSLSQSHMLTFGMDVGSFSAAKKFATKHGSPSPRAPRIPSLSQLLHSMHKRHSPAVQQIHDPSGVAITLWNIETRPTNSNRTDERHASFRRMHSTKW